METSNKATASPSSTSSNLIVFARLSGLLVAVLVLVWGLSCRSNFLSHTSSTHNAHIYSVFVIISGEAILVHKWCPGSRNLKKLVHLTMQGVALASGALGIRANFI
ncbi:probable transmembrane ascorbate ferrireductase 4 [Papaver somniferum]|uniref:probable transmembrane ascorbate ferrireductase 4 n=1 Tax=Papaver somniferum TaxID=3469 RepID=UPI000E6FBFC9|nr:probable transmembrane ascorbate ferrireductase 4 [Papaver somniferum]